MNRKLSLRLIAKCCFALGMLNWAHLAASQAPQSLEALKRGMPKDVVAFIDRTMACEHWSGEEPYDAARAKQIQQAVDRLKCESLPADEKRLRKKYTNNKRVLSVLDQVDAGG